MQKKLLRRFYPESKFEIFFLAVSLIAIVGRFIFIDRFPPGINHDEAEVLLSSVTYGLNASDVSGIAFPMSLFTTNTEAGLSGLPSVIMSPYFLVFGLSEFSARVFYFLLLVACAALFSTLLFRLTGSKNLAKIGFILQLLSPWMLFMSRALTEVPFALTFVLIFFNMFFSNKKRIVLLSFIPIVGAFLSYQGAKPITILLALFMVLISFKLKYKAQRLISLLLFISFSIVFIVLSMLNPQSTLSKRSSEVPLFSIENYANDVDRTRSMSITTPLTAVFENKIVYFLENMSKTYLGFLSPDVLFFSGDPAATYRVGNWGLIYVLDLAFLLVAFILFKQGGKKNQEVALFFLFILAIGMLGAIFSGVRTSYVFRNFLASIGILALTSIGLSKTIDISFRKIPIIYFFLLAYVFFYAFFVHRFMTIYPVSQQENQFYSEKVLSKFVSMHDESKKVLIIGISPEQFIYQYLIHSGEYKEVLAISKDNDRNRLTYKNLTISSQCQDSEGADIVISKKEICSAAEAKYVIQNFKDAGYIFEIYGDNVCSTHSVGNNFRPNHRLSDYNLDLLGLEEFCKRNIFNNYEKENKVKLPSL